MGRKSGDVILEHALDRAVRSAADHRRMRLPDLARLEHDARVLTHLQCAVGQRRRARRREFDPEEKVLREDRLAPVAQGWP